ncbi:MAG: anthranilate phosphoribosyltransferase [Gammaproteobacteria bacterium]|nr:MAG: anthranilate phosphoribosyltransferase [Gammaproteobacteria bacterium]
MTERDPDLLMRQCIQKIATGPELSKDLSFEEARDATALILDEKVHPVQAGVFFIALRMKRETDDENRGVLQAVLDATDTQVAEVEEVVDLADPYDGFTKSLPASPFLPAVLAACGVPAVSHGLERVGPKFGATHRQVLRAAGIEVDLSPTQAAQRVSDPDTGWAYVDQKAFCPKLHRLVPLRTLIVKRPCLSTVEVLAGPVRGRQKTHLVTGYVHKPYPRVYALLARHAGFDSALLVRGVEGGIIPSLQQTGKVFFYHDRGEEQPMEVDPSALGIQQTVRAAPLPPDIPKAEGGDEITAAVDTHALAQAAAERGMAALRGEKGPTYDALVYGGALCLYHLRRHATLPEAAEAVRHVLDSGEAHRRFACLSLS